MPDNPLDQILNQSLTRLGANGDKPKQEKKLSRSEIIKAGQNAAMLFPNAMNFIDGLRASQEPEQTQPGRLGMGDVKIAEQKPEDTTQSPDLLDKFFQPVKERINNIFAPFTNEEPKQEGNFVDNVLGKTFEGAKDMGGKLLGGLSELDKGNPVKGISDIVTGAVGLGATHFMLLDKVLRETPEALPINETIANIIAYPFDQTSQTSQLVKNIVDESIRQTLGVEPTENETAQAFAEMKSSLDQVAVAYGLFGALKKGGKPKEMVQELITQNPELANSKLLETVVNEHYKNIKPEENALKIINEELVKTKEELKTVGDYEALTQINQKLSKLEKDKANYEERLNPVQENKSGEIIEQPKPVSETVKTEEIVEKPSETKTEEITQTQNLSPELGKESVKPIEEIEVTKITRDNSATSNDLPVARVGGLEFPIETKGIVKSDFTAADLKDPIRLRQIGLDLVNNIGRDYGQSVRPNLVKRFMKKATGMFFPKSGIIRIRNLNDVSTLSHELGHWLDYDVFDIYKNASKPIKSELLKFTEDIGHYKVSTKEGIAEAINWYITKPEQSKVRTPKFNDFFESLLETNPEIKSAIKTAREQVKRYTEQDPRTITASTIEKNRDGFLEGLKKKYNKAKDADFEFEVFDVSKPIKDIEKQLVKKGVDVSHGNSAYSQYLKLIGADGIAEKYLRFGAPETGVRGYLEIIKDVSKNTDLDLFETYLVAQRNIELHSRGLKEGATTSLKDAEQTKSLIEKENPDILKQAQELYDYQNFILDKYYESGKLSTENYNKIKNDNQFYIPFKRFFDEIESSNKGYDIRKVLKDTSPSPVKMMRGSLKPVESPLGNVIKNTYELTVSAQRNEVLKQLVKDLGEIDKTLVQEIPKAKVTAHKVFDDSGNIEVRYGLDFKKPENAEIVSVWENGDVKYYQLSKDFYDGVFADTFPISKIVKALNIPTRTLQAGAVVYDPTFGIRNIGRDQPGAFFVSKHGYNPFDFFKGMFHVIKRDATYQKFMESGADMSFLTAIDRMMTKGYIEKKAGQNRQLKHSLNPLEALRSFNRLTELGTRVGSFQKAFQKTGDVYAAMQEARQITGDYGVKGRSMRNASLLYAFLNPRLQHLKLTKEVFTGQRGNVGKKIAQGMFWIGVPSAINWFINNQNEERSKLYKELPDWRKNQYWNMPIPFTDGFMPVPKGIYGQVFGSTIEGLLDWTLKNDPEAIKSLGGLFIKELLPVSSLVGLIPTAGQPITEVAFNTKAYTNTPIVPQRLEDLDAREQYNDWTPHIYRYFGDKFNISPLKIESLVTGYTAGTGRNIANLFDEALEYSGAVPDDDLTNMLGFETSKAPVFRGLYSDNPVGTRGKSVQDFYEKLDRLTGINKTVNYKIKNDKDADLENYLNRSDNRKDYKWYINNSSQIDKFKDAIKAFNEIKNEIRKDSTLNSDKKKQAVTEIDGKITSLAQSFNNSYKQDLTFNFKVEMEKVMENADIKLRLDAYDTKTGEKEKKLDEFKKTYKLEDLNSQNIEDLRRAVNQ